MSQIEKLLSDLSMSVSDNVLELKLHLKVSDGEITSRRLWLLLKPDGQPPQVSVQCSPSIPRLLEEQVVRHTGRFGGFIGVAKQGQVVFAASYEHHAKPREDCFGN